MSAITFEELVRISIYESVAKTMGDEAWQAINFYFDTGRVARDPEGFARLVDSLFGSRSKELERIIVKTLLDKMGRPAPPIVEGTRLDDWYSGQAKPKVSEFQDWIKRARISFVSSDSGAGSWMHSDH